jgi:spore coat polysaccharide biosynthesis predicted glycosyltransferase SpsG
MSACPEIRALFRAPAGARRGFGHLLRCRSLARALGVRPLLSIRGPQHSVDVALRLGCDVVKGSARQLMTALEPDILIVDDPLSHDAARWMAAARKAGIAVASIHDLGLGCLDADLLIDGSVTPGRSGRRRGAATGPAYAILDPDLPRVRSAASRPRRVVVSLGGGPRAEIACAIAGEIARRAPDVEVRVVGGFVSDAPPRRIWRRCPPNVVWKGPSTHLHGELAKADVAVVGGGMSLYEACALGAAAVGVPVVPAQRPTVAGFVRRGAALGRFRSAISPQAIADDVLLLLRRRGIRRQMARAGRRLVDGQGARRAARAIHRLIANPPPEAGQSQHWPSEPEPHRRHTRQPQAEAR